MDVSTPRTGPKGGQIVARAGPGAFVFAFVLMATLAACSSGGQGSENDPSLASTCQDVCTNVVGSCAGGSAPAVSQCLQSCQQLGGLQGTCVDKFGSYLACLSGATSISCRDGAVSVTFLSPSCDQQQQAYGACSGLPVSASACFGLGSHTAACAQDELFCIGAPPGCVPDGATLFGIGDYCCPG
jgi:hypothetical protein